MLALTVAANGLRWWCIATLGGRWTARVIVLPGEPLVRSGPYRWFSHPNYVAVIVEGAALPLTGSAWITAAVFTVANAVLLTVRIRCEARALAAAAVPGSRRGAVIDVLVVGGGPVGLATAIGCALAGLSVSVAEPRDGPVDKACGEGVMPAAVRRLAALGVDPGRVPAARASATSTGGTGPTRGSAAATAAACAARRCTPRWPGGPPQLGIPVLPVRVTGFEQHDGHVSAAGVRGALPGGGGRAALGDPPRPGTRRARRGRPGGRGRGGPVRAAPALPGRAVDRPGRGALVGAVRGVRDAGRRRRGRRRPAVRPGTGQRGARRVRRRGWRTSPRCSSRLGGAAPASAVRGAGPLRQDVRRRVYGRVLLVGDASGYLDALTGEGLGVGLAQAEALARCLAAGRPADYERAWRQVSRPAWRLTAGLLWSRGQPLLGPRIVPAAQRLPWLFSALVNHAAQA